MYSFHWLPHEADSVAHTGCTAMGPANTSSVSAGNRRLGMGGRPDRNRRGAINAEKEKREASLRKSRLCGCLSRTADAPRLQRVQSHKCARTVARYCTFHALQTRSVCGPA